MHYTLHLHGRLGCDAIARGVLAVLAATVAALAPLPAQAQLSCTPSAPRTDPGTGFVPFGTLERLEVRSGRLGAADWEWGLGVNTQQAGQFATANLDWVNERLYDWTLSYSGTGAATIEVRDGGALLFTRSWASGMEAGNALKLYVKSSAGIPAGTRVTATSATLNGQPAAGSIQSAGTGEFSEASLFWFYPAMSQGFTATGTVKLTFSGSYPPTGSRLNFIVTAGTVPCAPPPAQAKLYYIHVDHLNTPRLIADEQQRTVWRWDNTDPFGGNPPDENPSGLGTFEFPLRLPGQYFDKETNLHYNYYRDYDPSLGKYVESDPIGLKGGLNTYSYVASSPLVYVDPSGLEIICYQWWNVEVVTCEARCPPNVLGRGVGKYAGDAMLRAIANANAQLPAGCGLGDPLARAPDSARVLQQNECRPPLVLRRTLILGSIGHRRTLTSMRRLFVDAAMRRFALTFSAYLLIMLGLATSACADLKDDQRTLAYLSDTVTTKEPAAISAYRAKNGPNSVREFEELVRLYSAILDIKTLSDVDKRYWEYALMIAQGRLANAYRWKGEDARSREAAEKAIQHSRSALNRPLTSSREVADFIANVDRNLPNQ